MIHDVKIKSPSGRVKKVVKGRRLSRKHWDDFNQEEEGRMRTGLKPFSYLVPQNMKRILDVQFFGVGGDDADEG